MQVCGIRIRERRAKTNGKRHAQPHCLAPASKTIFPAAEQVATQKGRGAPSAKDQDSRYKARVNVHPQNHEDRQSQEQSLFASDVSSLEQEAREREEEPREQMRARKPMDGCCGHDKTGHPEGYRLPSTE